MFFLLANFVVWAQNRTMKIRFLPEKPARLLVLFGLLLAIVGGDALYRRWHPTFSCVTAHFTIQSSATPEQTKKVGEFVEILQATYKKTLPELVKADQTNAPLLQLKLFKDRTEFRRCHRGLGWAEAYYKYPCSHAYYSEEANPYQWMSHEVVHQLNREVSGLDLEKWCDEGIAEYFSTSIFRNGELRAGKVDHNTYPIWWLEDLALTGNLTNDIASTTIIPLRAIITDHGGPRMNTYFNLYYIHWWSLTHFLLESDNAKYRAGYVRLLQTEQTLENFEKEIGPVEQVQVEWYKYLRQQKWLLFRNRADRP